MRAHGPQGEPLPFESRSSLVPRFDLMTNCDWFLIFAKGKIEDWMSFKAGTLPSDRFVSD